MRHDNSMAFPFHLELRLWVLSVKYTREEIDGCSRPKLGSLELQPEPSSNCEFSCFRYVCLADCRRSVRSHRILALLGSE